MKRLIQKLTTRIKGIFICFLQYVIRNLTKTYNKLTYKPPTETPYTSLTSNKKAEGIEAYSKSLEWALSEPDITNIAITGTYGSGKSSFIDTFINETKKTNFIPLKISLATFKSTSKEGETQNDGEDTTETTYSSDINIEAIEKGILQQLIYHEKHSKTPNSRFSKIKKNNKWKIRITTLICCTLILSISYLVFNDKLKTLLSQNQTYFLNNWFYYLNLLIISSIGILIINKLVVFFQQNSITKIGFNKTTLEVKKQENKLTLNNQLDEILYFFEVTDYNTLIIEDLDRYDSIEIFIKLRHLNLLINNNKNIKNKKTVFIYSVKDDLFTTKERTKFFDFIVPIIPIINPFNSNEKFLSINEKNNYQISDNLINDISIFIDDMRLLYNIVNEYDIYSKQLNAQLNQDELLALIAYKNINPKDFSNLHFNKGILSESLNKIENLKNEFTNGIDNKINELNSELKQLNSLVIQNIKELRIIYFSPIIEKIIQTKKHPIHSIILNQLETPLNSIYNNKNFSDILHQNELSYKHFHSSHPVKFSYNFKDIEKSINSKFSYKEREEQTLNNSLITHLNEKIQQLKIKKNSIHNYSIQELLSDDILADNIINNDLINLLLRKGYITKNYHNYISIFHEGSISQHEYDFLISVKTQKKLPFDYRLKNTSKILQKLDSIDFQTHTILNFNIVDIVLSYSFYSEEKSTIFTLLSDESSTSVEFIDNYLETTQFPERFITELTLHWTNIWGFIDKETTYSRHKKNNYLLFILKATSREHWKPIFENHIKDLEKNNDFIRIANFTGTTENILEELNIKFDNIDIDDKSSMFVYIYQNNHYKLSPSNIKCILDFNLKYDETIFNTQNYHSINTSELEHLIKYIDDNINEYIEECYLKIKDNNQEPEESLLPLLKAPNITDANKTLIIEKVKTIISTTNKLTQKVIDLLFSNHKINPTWEIIIDEYIKYEYEFTETIINFFNSCTLESTSLSTDIVFKDEEVIEHFTDSLIDENRINDDVYQNIIDFIPYGYNSLETQKIQSKNKIKALINSSKITNSIENFNSLLEHHSPLHLLHFKKYSDTLEKELTEHHFTAEQIEKIINTDIIDDITKLKLLDLFSLEYYIDNITLFDSFTKIWLDNIQFKLSKDKILYISSNYKTSIEKQKLIFINHHSLFTFDEILMMINEIDEAPFPVIGTNKHPPIKTTKTNLEILDILKTQGIISSTTPINKEIVRINHPTNKKNN